MASAVRRPPRFSARVFALSAVAGLAAYCVLFYTLIKNQNYGVFLITAPTWLVFSLLGSSSILLAFAIENFIGSMRSRAAAAASTSAGTFAVGVTIVGCACSTPILASALYLFGANALQVSSVLVLFSDYQQAIVEGLVALNILMILRRVWQLRQTAT